MRCIMLSPSDPATAPFRVTFFFGPDMVGQDDSHRRCVFNVKKRSWKGGVQVSVDLSNAQVERMRTELDFATWMTEALQSVPDEDRTSVAQRMEEVFVQSLCARKLDLALGAGLEPRNQTIAADAWVAELDQITGTERELIYTWMRAELDLDESPPSNP